jgi:hypothetical protein
VSVHRTYEGELVGRLQGPLDFSAVFFTITEVYFFARIINSNHT